MRAGSDVTRKPGIANEYAAGVQESEETHEGRRAPEILLSFAYLPGLAHKR